MLYEVITNNALVIDNTGAFRDKEALSRHLRSKGVDKVLLTAPGKGIPNIVHGVNHLEYSPDAVNIFSAASCVITSYSIHYTKLYDMAEPLSAVKRQQV